MWANTRMVVLAAMSASLYAAILIPFKVIPLIPGITELRPANAVPVVCSFLFGPAAAWGAAIGNMIGDTFGGLGPGDVFSGVKMKIAKLAGEFTRSRKDVCLHTQSARWTAVLDTEPRAGLSGSTLLVWMRESGVDLGTIGLFALVALGLVLLTGVGGLTSFGQAAFAGIGAYATAWLSTKAGISPWWGLAVGLLITLGVALVLGWVTLRMSGHYLPLATIAWSLALYYTMGNLDALGKYDGLLGVPPLTLFGLSL